MQTTVEFHSTLFTPFLPDEAQVNPGRYGAELAYWLSRQLAQRGVATSYPRNDDWGWYLEYIAPAGNGYRVCCASVDGEQDRWRCFLDPKPRGPFGGKAPVEGAHALMAALREVLAQDPGIGNATWE